MGIPNSERYSTAGRYLLVSHTRGEKASKQAACHSSVDATNAASPAMLPPAAFTRTRCATTASLQSTELASARSPLLLLPRHATTATKLGTSPQNALPQRGPSATTATAKVTSRRSAPIRLLPPLLSATTASRLAISPEIAHPALLKVLTELLPPTAAARCATTVASLATLVRRATRTQPVPPRPLVPADEASPRRLFATPVAVSTTPRPTALPLPTLPLQPRPSRPRLVTTAAYCTSPATATSQRLSASAHQRPATTAATSLTLRGIATSPRSSVSALPRLATTVVTIPTPPETATSHESQRRATSAAPSSTSPPAAPQPRPSHLLLSPKRLQATRTSASGCRESLKKSRKCRVTCCVSHLLTYSATCTKISMNSSEKRMAQLLLAMHSLY